MSKRLPKLMVGVSVVGVQVGAHSAAEEDWVLGDGCTGASRTGFSRVVATGGGVVQQWLR